MSDTPQPVDIRRLAGALKGAKNVMKKVDSGDFSKGNVDATAFETDGTQLVDEASVSQMGGQPQAPKNDPVPFKNLKTSKMPEHIKQAMVENQIPNPMQSNTFNLEDLDELIEKPMPTPQVQNRQSQPKQQIQESRVMQGNDTFTVSESALRGIIKDVLIEYLSGEYAKTLSEGVIKKTINTLIKEGKVGVKKKRTRS